LNYTRMHLHKNLPKILSAPSQNTFCQYLAKYLPNYLPGICMGHDTMRSCALGNIVKPTQLY